MTTPNHDTDDDGQAGRTVFSRTGVSGQFGPLTEVLKTSVDMATFSKFHMRCNKAGQTISEGLRDLIWILEHGKPYTQASFEEGQRKWAAVFGEDLKQVVIGTNSVPSQGGAE